MTDKVTETGRTYTEIADEYAAARRDRSSLQAHFDRFSRLARSGGVVLDVGCGPGFDTAVLHQRGFRAIGLDLSHAMLRAGKQPVPLIQADMRRLPIRSGVDGIWSCAALLHLPRADMPPLLRQFYRLLAPGGVLYLSLKLGDGERWSRDSYGRRAPRFFTFWQPDTLDPLLQETGFAIPDGWIDNADKQPWLVRFARKPT